MTKKSPSLEFPTANQSRRRENSSCQTSLANAAWGKTDSIKTVIAFVDTHLKALTFANKWKLPKKVLRRDYPGNQLANITTVSFFEPFLVQFYDETELLSLN